MKRAHSIPIAGLLTTLLLLFINNSNGQTIILSEGFESAFPGTWSVGDANLFGYTAYWDDVYFTFGTPYPHTGNWCGYCAGVGYGGPSTAPYYQNSMSSFMTRNFSLLGYGSATLSFWYTIPSIESGYDYFRVYIDNNLVFQKSSAATLWTYVSIDLTPYVGGIHSLEFDFISDSSNVAEGAYLDDILITAVGLPNLTPYQPVGWSDKIVVAKTTGTTVDYTPLTAADNLYVDWAVINDGLVSTSSKFTTEIYVDGILRYTWTNNPPLNPDYYTSVQDQSIGALAAGTHTVRIKTDAGGTISESDGSDNEYTKTIIVGTYSVSAQWEGMFTSQTFAPPDPHGAAGPSGILQTVNTQIKYFTKAGSAIWGPVNLATFWAGTGNTGQGLSDPKVLYDSSSGRFYVILQENTSTHGFLNVAVSKSSNPTSSGTADWYFYRFDVTETSEGINYGPDYPGFGIDGQALYVTYNMYPLPFGPGSVGMRNSQIIVLNKASLAGGAASISRIFASTASGRGTLQPTTVVGGATPGNVVYFLEEYSNSSLRVWALTDPLGAQNLTYTILGVPDNGGPIGGAPQAGTTLTIDTTSDRLQGSAFWRNGVVWVCGTAGGSSGRSKVYYYKIDINSYPSGTPTLAESGSIDGGPGVWTYQPAIGANTQGDVCMVYCQSSISTFPTIMYTARSPSAGAFASPSVLKVSPNFYDGSSNLPDPGRWGDFATVSADPVNGSFWVSHEFARSSYPDDWGTWWGHLVVVTPPDTTPPLVSITNPPSARTYTNSQTVTLYATASDNVAISTVEFYDGATLKAIDAAVPYTCDWTFTGTNNGTHVWTARAYDAAGNVSTSSPVTLTVSIDITPPLVAISSPTNGQVLTTSTITVSGTATDSGSPTSGLSSVQVRVNGGNWTNATGTTSWTRSVTLAPCPNTIEARSLDKAGNYSLIASNFVTYVPPNTVPNAPVNLLPAAGERNVSVTPALQASAFSDPDCVGDTHAASQWQVLTPGAVVVADSGTDTVNRVAWIVPARKLYYGSNYQWQVRYRDSRNGWSGYSSRTFFTNSGPPLAGVAHSTNIVLNWPTNSVGFTLQWSTNLNTAYWSNATPLPLIVNGQYAVTNNMTNKFRFYRLKKP